MEYTHTNYMNNNQVNFRIANYMGAKPAGGMATAKDGTDTALFVINVQGRRVVFTSKEVDAREAGRAGLSSLEYNSSWDWLIPVWQVIVSQEKYKTMIKEAKNMAVRNLFYAAIEDDNIKMAARVVLYAIEHCI